LAKIQQQIILNSKKVAFFNSAVAFRWNEDQFKFFI